MAGGRLLRELLRERGAYFRYQLQAPRPTAGLFRAAHEQEHHRPFDGAIFISSTDSAERATVPPNLFPGPSFRSSAAFHMQQSAYDTPPHITGGRLSRHLCQIGHPCSRMVRHSSTVPGIQLEGELQGFGGNADGLDAASGEVTQKLASTDVQTMGEVSAIIGDCSYPTAFVQILMENVHTYLGLPWWGAIVATTIGIRVLCLPIMAYQMKTTAKLSLIRPRIEKINERIKASNYDPVVSSEGRNEMLALFKEYNTHPLAPFAGALLQAPVFISFFFAIQNMCERLEPFKHGGLLLFTDLAAKDTTFILPITLSAVMLLTVELNAAEGMEGNPYTGHMKTGLRIFSLVLLPISMNFPTGLFFYWIPSNFFSLFQSYLFKQKAIKEFVGIPSTEHLAASSAPELPVKPALLDDVKAPVKKKLPFGRSKSKGHRRR